MDDLNKSDKALLQDIKDNKVKEVEGGEELSTHNGVF
jgi:hypothetical protein